MPTHLKPSRRKNLKGMYRFAENRNTVAGGTSILTGDVKRVWFHDGY